MTSSWFFLSTLNNYVFEVAVKYLQIYLFFPQYYTNIYTVVSRSKCICQSLLSTLQKLVERKVNTHSRTKLMASHITKPCSGPQDQLCTNNYQTVLQKGTCNFHFCFYEASMGTGFFRGGIIKWSRHEADHSPKSSAKVKNECSYTCTPH